MQKNIWNSIIFILYFDFIIIYIKFYYINFKKYIKKYKNKIIYLKLI